MCKKIEIDFNGERESRTTFETRFATRARVPVLIDEEEYEVIFGLEMKCNETGDCLRVDLWIDELEGAPDFEISDKLADELEEYIIELDEGGAVKWKGEEN